MLRQGQTQTWTGEHGEHGSIRELSRADLRLQVLPHTCCYCYLGCYYHDDDDGDCLKPLLLLLLLLLLLPSLLARRAFENVIAWPGVGKSTSTATATATATSRPLLPQLLLLLLTTTEYY